MPRTDVRGGPRTRAHISQVATSLIVERGYDAVTVAEIARQAGVSTVTVFNHFRRKEDLFLDRGEDAAELVRAAIRDRGPDVDVLTSLREVAVRLCASEHPLSGLHDRSVRFFQTVAESPALVARAREIAAEVQKVLADELDQDPRFAGDAALLAALFIGGYTAVMVETARRRIDGASKRTVKKDHRARLERMFDALRSGITTDRGVRRSARRA